MSEKLRESREAISVIDRVLKNLDGLKSVKEIAELQLQIAAYRYAITYQLDNASIEKLQRRYEEALTAARLGINPYPMILRHDDFASTLEKLEKKFRKTKRNREKLTIDEIDMSIVEIDSMSEKYKSIFSKIKETLLKQRPKAIVKEAEKQGFNDEY